MKSALIGLLAETFIHSGVGQSIGAIDLPVARERTTDYPIIPGSGMKGAFKTWAKEQASAVNIDVDSVFGKAEGAGSVLFSDARLVLLPVRSLSTAYVWLTCPILLERLQRDILRTGGKAGFDLKSMPINDGRYICSTTAGSVSGTLCLEEREFEPMAQPDQTKQHLQQATFEQITIALKMLLPAGAARDRIPSQTIIISDSEFAWFAKYALPISAHNQLEPDTKRSKQLWYEETLPPDTVMHTLLIDRGGGKQVNGVNNITDSVSEAPYCQIGGNETLGQGWFHLTQAHPAPPKSTQPVIA